MDEGLRRGRMCHVLKAEEERRPPPRQTGQWDSAESDTESLAQERAFRLQAGHHDQITFMWHQKENAESLQQGNRGEDDANKEENEYLHLYDSLEVEAHRQAEDSPFLLHTKRLGTRIEEKRQLLSDDAYSDLRYDPNWRTNLKGAGRFHESPQIPVEELHQNPEEPSSRSCADRGGPVIKGGYRYIVDTSTAPVLTPHTATNESDHLYRLHPQHDPTRSPEAGLPASFGISARNESDRTLQRGFRQMGEKSFGDVGENIGGTSEQTEDLQHIQEGQTCFQHEVKHTQEEPVQTQQRSTFPPMGPRVLSNRNQCPLTEDIVQHNISTLGRSAPKRGSYAKVHALKQETPHQKKVHVALEKTASAGSQKGSSAPKASSLQKTQQLTVAGISEGRKAQRKEYPSPSRRQQPPAPRVEAEHGDCLSSQLAESATTTQTKAQKTTSSQPLPSTVHLSIHLNAPSHLLPLLQQMGQDAIISLPSLHDGTPKNSASKGALSPACKQTNLEKSSHVSRKGLNAHRSHQNWESGLEQWQRTAELKWPPYEGQDQRWSPHEGYTAQNLPRTLTSALSQVMGSYAVLPPIEKPTTGKGAEPSCGPGVNAEYPIQRSSSDGYLVQMERQKQMRAKGTHRASCGKDYKQLKSDTESQGLSPDGTATEKTKLKRQKLYSNAIREQNKKLSRIPFPPTKDPKDHDKKVPRMKALEYVKTIAKPPVQSQPKGKQRSQSEHAPSLLKDLDVSQLATLELLRKRHEEEKQAVALFTKQHAA